MEITKEKTVADFVTENIKTAHIFKKYGIDFCCGGSITLEKACTKNNVDQAVLEKELLKVNTAVDVMHDFDNWKLDFLIDYIINIHHTYVNESLPIISQYASKVAKVHGQNYPEVIEINDLFQEIAGELVPHMQKEERILFPYIKQLIKADKEGEVLSPPPFGSVSNPIQMMEYEHENVGNVFKTISVLTNNYSPPESACNTFRALYAKLDEFEQDLHQHIHLENNILHPRAIILANKVIL